MVCVVRGDLLPGHQIAQTSHAVADYATVHPELFTEWHTESNTIVCLQAKDEAQLSGLLQKLSEQGHPVVGFREPDFDNSLTALAIVADPELRKKFSSLSLAGKVKNA